MDFENLKPSDQVTVLAEIDPISQGAGTVTTGWVLASTFNRIMALIATGVMGASATLDAKIQQAQDASGTGAKDVTGSSITQIVKATGDNKFAFINLDPQRLDVANGFNYIRLSMTVGTAASLIAGYLWGLTPRYGVAAHAAGFKEAVNVN